MIGKLMGNYIHTYMLGLSTLHHNYELKSLKLNLTYTFTCCIILSTCMDVSKINREISQQRISGPPSPSASKMYKIIAFSKHLKPRNGNFSLIRSSADVCLETVSNTSYVRVSIWAVVNGVQIMLL